MTKDQFLGGMPFNIRSDKNLYHKFIPSDNIRSIGHINLYDNYLCNVDKVTDKYVYAYTSVLGKCVNVRVALADLVCE